MSVNRTELRRLERCVWMLSGVFLGMDSSFWLIGISLVSVFVVSWWNEYEDGKRLNENSN